MIKAKARLLRHFQATQEADLAKLLIVYSLPHTFCLEISFDILCSIYPSPAAFPSSKQVHHCQYLGLIVVRLHKNCFEIKYASCLVEYIKQTQVLSKDMPRLLKSLLDYFQLEDKLSNWRTNCQIGGHGGQIVQMEDVLLIGGHLCSMIGWIVQPF